MIADHDLKRRVKTALAERSLRLVDLARRLRTPYGTLASWLGGFSAAPENLIQRIEACLGLPEGALQPQAASEDRQ